MPIGSPDMKKQANCKPELEGVVDKEAAWGFTVAGVSGLSLLVVRSP